MRCVFEIPKSVTHKTFFAFYSELLSLNFTTSLKNDQFFYSHSFKSFVIIMQTSRVKRRRIFSSFRATAWEWIRSFIENRWNWFYWWLYFVFFRYAIEGKFAQFHKVWQLTIKTQPDIRWRGQNYNSLFQV